MRPEHGPFADALRAPGPAGKSDLHDRPGTDDDAAVAVAAAAAADADPDPSQGSTGGVADADARSQAALPAARSDVEAAHDRHAAEGCDHGRPAGEARQSRGDAVPQGRLPRGSSERTLADPKKTFTVGLKPEQLGGGKVDGKPIHKDVAAEPRRSSTRPAPPATQAKADKKGERTTRSRSRLRGRGDGGARTESIEDDFGAWQGAYPTRSLGERRPHATALPDGPLQARPRSRRRRQLPRQLQSRSRVQQPLQGHGSGFSRRKQDGVPLTTSTRQHELWQNSWLFKWLTTTPSSIT